MKNFSISILLLFIAFFSCTTSGMKEEQPMGEWEYLNKLSEESLELNGIQLAAVYCGACHLKPGPELLDKKTWETTVLPEMRRRLGLVIAEDFGHDVGEDTNAPPGIYSTKKLISRENWDKIQTYYLDAAPEKLPTIESKLDSEGPIPGFSLIFPQYKNKRPNLTTLTRWDGISNQLIIGDRFRRLYTVEGKTLEIMDSLSISSPASDIRFRENGTFDLLTMGVMDPSNFAIGKWLAYSAFDMQVEEIKMDSLRRPVHFSFSDLNQNGKEDVVVCNFGHHIGNLSWYENTDAGFIQHVLNTEPGARKTIIADFNLDGLPDIAVLMTQAKEGIYAYINQGNGNFKQEVWLNFHPVFGGSDFEMADMNADGYLDIVLVNGDNADYSPILKPYHGLRIFLNDGQNRFEEKMFYPMHGASGLLVADFDQNGGLDIAVLSYFPDPSKSPKQNFLYFKNHGLMDFSVHALENQRNNSWLTIEKGDVDQDGSLDIILGSFDFKSQRAYPMENWMPFAILKNQGMN
ncbi:VCBS repeat-containing protein [Rhodonellum sp.]|uniref:FG-GAP repeat domain-containing protein n=1 Tax=Rhodonellum sp. TaxID=2231180 RepID=UPI002723E4F5|nr:VCBS repeat-containing protein [Rhodonellum sp.]MDO9551177.1 VCBS repeat-containing protein [Rhodonellum sp.]